MSIYTKFGVGTDSGITGPQGPPGIGFELTPEGDYDLNAKKITNIAADENNDLDIVLALDPADNEIKETNLSSFVKKYDDILISDLATPVSSTADLHLQSNGSVNVWLQSDRDNLVETDVPTMYLTTDGNNNASSVGLTDDEGLRFCHGNEISNANGKFTFQSIRTTGGANLPAFVSPTTLLSMNTTQITAGRKLNMSNLPIESAGSLNFSTIPTTATDTELLTVAPTGTITKRTIDSVTNNISGATLNYNSGEFNTLDLAPISATDTEFLTISPGGTVTKRSTVSTFDAISGTSANYTVGTFNSGSINSLSVNDFNTDDITFDTVPTTATDTELLTLAPSGTVTKRTISSATNSISGSTLNYNSGDFTNLTADNATITSGPVINSTSTTYPATYDYFRDTGSGTENILQFGSDINIAKSIDMNNNNITRANVISVAGLTPWTGSTVYCSGNFEPDMLQYFNDKTALYTKTGVSLGVGPTLLTNWTSVTTSTDVDFNTTTGVLNGSGLYSITITISSTDSVGTTKSIGVVVKSTDDTITAYAKENQVANLFAGFTNFIFTDNVASLITIPVKWYSSCSTAITADFRLTINKLITYV